MNNIKPFVSIFCLAYNHEPFIRQCLDRIVMQKTNFPLEILIHDDASTDRTAEIIREYEIKYPGLVKPIYEMENQYSKGRKLNLTYSFPRAKGKYIAYCDCDDYWTDPYKLQKQVDFLESHDEYSVCTSGYMINKDGVMTENVIRHGTENGFAYSGYDGWYWKTLVAVFRYSDLVDSGYFKDYKKYKYLKDTHLFHYLLSTKKGWYMSECFGVCNIHPGGIWSSLTDGQRIIKNYIVFKELYKVTRDAGPYNLYYSYLEYIITHHLYEGKRDRLCFLFEHYNKDMQTRKTAIKLLVKKCLKKIFLTLQLLNKFVNIFLEKIYCKINWMRDEIKFKIVAMFDRRLTGSLKDCCVHIHTTTGCNCRCKFCGYIKNLQYHPRIDIDFKILYEYLLPIYKKSKTVMLTGGECLIVDGLYEYCQFLSEKYPHVTIYLESNGIAFDEKWQKLAADNLFLIHFSVNGSNEEAFMKGCWSEGGGAYKKSQENILTYMRILRERNLEVFAPIVTMVINNESAYDVVDFLRYSLREGFRKCGFMFDYHETDMDNGLFNSPEIMHPVYRELLKLERLLAGKYEISFRLFRPLQGVSELEQMEEEVKSININELKEEYADIWELAKNRDIKQEIMMRQTIRKAHDKKLWTNREETENTCFHYKRISGRYICNNPFNALNIRTDGTFDVCTKIMQRFRFGNRKKEARLAIQSFINSPVMKKWRFDVLHGDWSYCQKSCPYRFPYRPGLNSYEVIFEK
jgi:glycosyltransferase involved in cell wall biosynthesis/organic radical activating enzyme